MARMNPCIRPEEGEVVFFESGVPFLFQNSRHHVIKTLGGSRCSLWGELLFFSRSDGKPARLFWPIIQKASKSAIRASTRLVALCSTYRVRNVPEFLASRDVCRELATPGDAPAIVPSWLTANAEQNFTPRLTTLIRQQTAPAAYQKKPPRPHFVFVTDSLSAGGAERQWCYLARELARRGYLVSLLVDNLREHHAHYLPLLTGSPVAIHAIETYRTAIDVDLSIPTGIPYSVARYVLALRHLRPTHVLCQLDYPNLLGGAGALLADCGVERVLLSFRNVNPSHFDYIHTSWMLPWYQALLRSPQVVLSGNSLAGNLDYAAWLGIPKQQIAYIPNALSVEAFQSTCSRGESRRRLGIPEYAPVILGVFRLSAEKNPLLFLRVIQRLLQKYPNLTVLHAGEGHDAESVHAAAREYGLDSSVRFFGRREDIPDLMQAADLLLLCSDHEGLPNVLLEAQAQELPVVTTDAGSARDAIREGATGLLAQRNDLETLTRHCETLLDDPQKRQAMGRAGRAFVLERFTPEALADNTLAALGL